MASQSLSILATPLPSSKSRHTNPSKPSSLLTTLLGTQLSLRNLTASWPSIHKKLSPAALPTVSFSLPTTDTGVPLEKSPKWSARAIKAFGMAELEARKLKYPTTGTEALLMGILVEGTSLAAKFLRANGITLFNVRDEIVKLLGKSDLYFFSPEHPPLTEPAQRVLDYAIREKLKSGVEGEITTTYLLLGIWNEKESAGHKIMASFGFDDEKAAELAKSKDQDYVLSYR